VRKGFEPELETGFLGLRSDRKRINDSEDEPKDEKFRSNTGQRFGRKIYVIVKDLVLGIAEGDVEEFCLGGSVSAIYSLIPIPRKSEDLISIYSHGIHATIILSSRGRR
jgi:hypothetical protein